MDNVQIRRQILQLLYDELRDNPPGGVELSEIANRLAQGQQAIQFNINYLAEKELIEISKTMIRPRTFLFIQITATGIDLVEDPNEFNNRFPPQVVQNIIGDKFEVVVGDNASNVAVGKDIRQIASIAPDADGLAQICTAYLYELQDASGPDAPQLADVAAALERLERTLADDDPDLGEVQRIKRLLVEHEGAPALRTEKLFGSEVVVQRVRRAVARLIGDIRE
jgi:hypothetical protein